MLLSQKYITTRVAYNNRLLKREGCYDELVLNEEGRLNAQKQVKKGNAGSGSGCEAPTAPFIIMKSKE